MATACDARPDWMIILVTLICVGVHTIQCATQAEERSSEKVKIKLYDLSTSGWTTSKRNTFSTVIASEANDYCTSSPSSCGLDSAATFSSSEVGTSGADKDGNSIEFTFYIDFPAGASVSTGGGTARVVPKSAAQAIAAAARDEVNDEVGHYITYIDDEYYSIPPNTDTNKVIIPIVFVVVFLLAIAVVALHYHQKHSERKQLIAKRLRKKQQQQQQGVAGANASYSALDTTNTTILTTNNSTTPRRGYMNNNNIDNGTPNSHIKFTARDKLPRDECKEDDETGPVVVSLASGKPAQHHPPSANRRSKPMTSSSVNDFHDGDMVIGDDNSTKLGHVQKSKRVEQFSVTETLEEDEARRERKRKRREKRNERKRREEEEAGGERVMENYYENPVFNSSNLSEGSHSYLH